LVFDSMALIRLDSGEKVAVWPPERGGPPCL
jgi:hypothetical protein